MGRLMLRCAAVAACAGAASGQVLFFDFGREDLQSDPASFNNLIPAVQSIADSIDENGNATGISVTVTDEFFIAGEPSSLGSEAPTGAAAQFGVPAADDYFFGHTTPFAGQDANPLGVVEFGGLQDGLTYTFTIFSSRQIVGDIRDASHSAVGGNTVEGVLNASNNDSEVLVLEGVTPDANGVITLSVSPGPENNNGNGFFYLGAVRLDVVPAPGAAVVLAAGGLVAVRRRR